MDDIESYFRSIQTVLEETPIVHSSSITYDKRSQFIGFIRGEIYFLDGSVLYIREFVNVENTLDRYMYVYHYQDTHTHLLFRYDNTSHFPHLPTFPHHKHVGSETNVVASFAPNLPSILQEIQIVLQRPSD